VVGSDEVFFAGTAIFDGFVAVFIAVGLIVLDSPA
jgi:hypothetical protein